MNSIQPLELDARIAAGEVVRSQIIDVRTPAERREAHIKGSGFLPLESINAEDLRTMTAGGQTYLLCRSGSRAAKALTKLAKEGVTDPMVVEGGMEAWEKAGLPVVIGSSMVSLERQVRVASGLLVLLGTLLGFLVHPYFHYLSAFVGAGLVFAGATNTCAMGMTISKMPWNRRKPNEVAA